MKRKILALIGAVMMGVMVFSAVPMEVGAAKNDDKTEATEDVDNNGNTGGTKAASYSGKGCDSGSFLGFRAWYAGLPCENGAIKAPKDESGNGDASGGLIAAFVWIIVANILVDLFMVVGFLAVGFLMYGGYLYIMSNGDPGKVASGMKTIKAAIIGLIIAILANVIIRTILVILGV